MCGPPDGQRRARRRPASSQHISRYVRHPALTLHGVHDVECVGASEGPEWDSDEDSDLVTAAKKQPSQKDITTRRGLVKSLFPKGAPRCHVCAIDAPFSRLPDEDVESNSSRSDWLPDGRQASHGPVECEFPLMCSMIVWHCHHFHDSATQVWKQYLLCPRC